MNRSDASPSSKYTVKGSRRRLRGYGDVKAAQAVKRGDVFWADIARRSGSKRSGRRPVVIVSHDGFNRVEG